MCRRRRLNSRVSDQPWQNVLFSLHSVLPVSSSVSIVNETTLQSLMHEEQELLFKSSVRTSLLLDSIDFSLENNKLVFSIRMSMKRAIIAHVCRRKDSFKDTLAERDIWENISLGIWLNKLSSFISVYYWTENLHLFLSWNTLWYHFIPVYS